MRRGRGLTATLLAGAFALVLLGSGMSVADAAARPATTIPCSEKKLDSAVKKGGTIDFGAACTITITKTITIGKSANVTIQGDGFQVELAGNTAVRLFVVSGGTLSISGIELANGKATGSTGTNGAWGTSGTGGSQGAAGAPGTE